MAKSMQPASTKKQLNEFAPVAALAYPAVDYIMGTIAALGVAWFGSKVVQTASNSITRPSSSSSWRREDNAPLHVEPPVDPAYYASPANTIHTASGYATAPDAVLPAFKPQHVFTQAVVDIADDAAQAASSSSNSSSNGKRSWWKSLLSWCGSLVTGFLGWLAGFLAQFGIVVSTQVLAGILAGIATVASYLVPRVTMWVRRAMKKHVIAEVVFTTSGNDEVNAWFSYDDFKWHVDYLGARLASRPNVPDADKMQLMQTKFFNKFVDECKKTLHGMLDDEDRLTACASLVLVMKDKDDIEEYKKILNAKDDILA